MVLKTTENSYVISSGHCRRLGSTIEKDGVNFAIWSPHARAMDLLLFKNVDDDNPTIITLSSPIFRSTYYWHVKVLGLKAGQIYAWAVNSTVRYNNNVELNKVLLDPYAKRVLFPTNYKRYQTNKLKENFLTAPKSVVVDMDDYDWGIDVHPRHSLAKTVIYEMHVKGFTAHKSSKLNDNIKGTYKGLIEKIPYLVELGVTAVELLPIYQFDTEDAIPNKKNYWGYCPMAFFAPHEQYSSDKSIMGPLNEFRDLVKELHKNGLEVILDVVYNHTSEGDKNGPVFSFKGFDKEGYYIVDSNGNYGNYSGCGNTFNGTTPVVRKLILDSLIFWVEQMHVDGFRFDLASILARDTEGKPIAQSPTLLDIDANFRLADTKIIAEPWDAGGLYQLGNVAGSKWREWNGQFRDDVRSFMRGDSGSIKKFVNRVLGSPDIYNEHDVDPQKSINFITCHDGFTLWDLVSYHTKHNLDNGENNKDGCDNNYSANYGVEGETSDEALNALRLRQAKNFMCLTLLSMGTPMICMGDEVLRTQKGNNNAYCQDNDLSYMNWDFTEMQKEMLNFTKALVARRTYKSHYQAKHTQHHFKMLDSVLRSTKLQWHGVLPYQPDWSDSSHAIGVMVYWGFYEIYSYFFVNAYWEDLEIELPPPPKSPKHKWYCLVDTAKRPPYDVQLHSNVKLYQGGDKVKIKARSIFMLISHEL